MRESKREAKAVSKASKVRQFSLGDMPEKEVGYEESKIGEGPVQGAEGFMPYESHQGLQQHFTHFN